MSQAELLALVIKVLDELQIPYMLVGSYASSFYGEPRSTHDIDLVIDLGPEKILSLVSAFDPTRYYLSEAALREGRMGNLIDLETGDKVDCFLLDNEPISRLAFSRRSKQRIMNIDADIASAEDTILSKLNWSKMAGGLPRQQADVREMLKARRGELDLSYLREQAKAMELSEALQEHLIALGMNELEHDV